MRDMKESALQYTTFGYAQLHHTDIIKVVLVPHSLEVVAEILDCEIEHYEINIEDGAGTDTLGELSALKGAQYKLMRGHKFGHAPEFTRVELVAMDDALTQWIEMNEENEDQPSNEAYYACIAWNKITKALQKMG
tara:strand:+ start:732 stop:1136 length:405 start_codon:yes stop_codon:yes gene_type:complete